MFRPFWHHHASTFSVGCISQPLKLTSVYNIFCKQAAGDERKQIACLCKSSADGNKQHSMTVRYNIYVIIVFQQPWGSARYILQNESLHSSDWYIQFPEHYHKPPGRNFTVQRLHKRPEMSVKGEREQVTELFQTCKTMSRLRPYQLRQHNSILGTSN